jgi:aspartate aminotransferase
MRHFKLSERARAVGVSATLAVDERLQELRAAGQDVIALGAGQPDFETPQMAKDAAGEAIEAGRTRYTPVAGTPALRAAIARKLQEENGIAVSAQEVVVSNGAKQALYNTLLALVDIDDEVLVPTPAWPSYMEMIRLAGGRPRLIPTTRDSGYLLTAESLMREVRLSPGKPLVLMLNNPCNPTGAVYSGENLLRLAEVVAGENVFVVTDEIYEHLVYGEAFVSFAALPQMAERTVTINGVSKVFAMTGWRIGYAAGPAGLMGAIKAIQSHTTGNPCSISQAAAESAILASLDTEAGRGFVKEMRDTFFARRDLVHRLLSGIPGVRYAKPNGAFYFFLDLSEHYGRELAGRRVENSVDMAAALLDEAGVGVVPGCDFGDDRCVRLSFAASEEDLAVAIRRMARALEPSKAGAGGGEPGDEI